MVGLAARNGYRLDCLTSLHLLSIPTNIARSVRSSFLATAAGQVHFENIKTYYRNLAVWLARPELIHCMNRRILWASIFDARVVEAVATVYEVPLHRAGIKGIWDVGKQARDVLGNRTSSCQAWVIILDLLDDFIEIKLRRAIDPWWPWPPPGPDPPVPWFGLQPILDSALGGAVIALRDEFLDIDESRLEEAEERFDEIARNGVEYAIRAASENAREGASRFLDLIGGENRAG